MTANLDALNCSHKSVQTNNDQFMESPLVQLIKIQKYEQSGIAGQCHVTECLISYSPRRESSSISNVKKLTAYFESIIKTNKDFFICKQPERRLTLNRRRSLPAHDKTNYYNTKKHGHSETCLLSASSATHKRSKLNPKLIAETMSGDSPSASTFKPPTKKDIQTRFHETVTIKEVSSVNRAQFGSTPSSAFREQRKRYTFSGEHPVASFAEKIKFFNRISK